MMKQIRSVERALRQLKGNVKGVVQFPVEGGKAVDEAKLTLFLDELHDWLMFRSVEFWEELASCAAAFSPERFEELVKERSV